jgi:hypothetical protein
VDAWTSSLADSRANHSALLESVQALKTHDTYSRTSGTELERANLELFSSKMLKELSQVRPPMESRFSSMSSGSWKDWVTEQRQEFSQRVKSAHLTRESGSSSWATPQAFDHVNIVRTPEKLAQTRAEKNAGCMNLREQVHYPNMNHSRKAAKNWPTPTTAEGTKIGNQPNFGQVGLSNHPSIVGQPDRAKLNKSGKSQESWSTPQARDWKGAEGRAYKGQTKDLPAQTESQGKLNPDWVEQLMGLPVGWTDLGSWAME